ncbi:hypothetical protein GOP47_0001332 [Adiantum capillus-veneris]|uniref:Uncharacterized protein n=1 Tax=Adiantum capillus-veneris TaxID=13818 RepID=A0A9D4V8Q4_ADICA|nr:hypothetical protein GOP47_0001332 [Adiantum capillus-veneris]
MAPAQPASPVGPAPRNRPDSTLQNPQKEIVLTKVSTSSKNQPYSGFRIGLCFRINKKVNLFQAFKSPEVGDSTVKKVIPLISIKSIRPVDLS